MSISTESGRVAGAAGKAPRDTSRSSEEGRAKPRSAGASDVAGETSVRGFLIATTVTFVLIIGAAWVWAINGKMYFMDPEYAMWRVKTDMLQACRHGDTLILGDSRPMAGLIPEVMGPGVVNFGLGGGGPIETYYLVRDILKCPTRPKQVIISIAPSQMMGANWYWSRAVAFGFLDYDQTEDVRRQSRRLNDPLLYSPGSGLDAALDMVRNLSYRIGLPSYYFAPMFRAGLFTRKERNDAELQSLLRSRGHRLFGTEPRSDGLSQEGFLGKFRASPLLDYYFDGTIAMLRDQNIPVYFSSLPMNEASASKARPELPREFADYLAGYAKRYPNFHVSEPALPVWSNAYFGDPQHLNAKGAELWSKAVAERLLPPAQIKGR